jgi:hypothetical protein
VADDVAVVDIMSNGWVEPGVGAGCRGEEFPTASAAAYACESAEVTYTNTHRVSGGIGVISEYGLVLWTLRLVAPRAALGGARMHARQVAASRRLMDRGARPHRCI